MGNNQQEQQVQIDPRNPISQSVSQSVQINQIRMGHDQSKQDDKCRQEMRQKVKEAKKRKALASEADKQYKVVNMDKLGSIEDHHDQSDIPGQGEPQSLQSGISEDMLHVSEPTTTTILVQTTKISHSAGAAAQGTTSKLLDSGGSGQSDGDIFNVVDKQQQSYRGVKGNAGEYQSGSEESEGEEDHVNGAMETLRMTQDSVSTYNGDFAGSGVKGSFSGGGVRANSLFSDGQEQEGQARGGTEVAHFGGSSQRSAAVAQSKKEKRQARREEKAKQEQAACNVGCAFFSRGGNPQEQQQQKGLKLASKGSLSARGTDKGITSGRGLLKRGNAGTDKSKGGALDGKKQALQLMIKKDQKKRIDDFEEQRSHKIADKQQSRMIRMRMPQEQRQAILESGETCCDQCSMPVPLVCWRFKIRFALEQNRIVPLGAEAEQVGTDSDAAINRPSPVQDLRRQPKTDPFHKFALLDAWRQDLLDYMDEQSGSFSTHDKQHVSNFYDYERYMAKMALQQKATDQADAPTTSYRPPTSSSSSKLISDYQMLNNMQLRQSQEISLAIARDKRQMSVETGQSVLMCDERIHEVVLFINKQLEVATHPIRMAMDTFKRRFHETNMVLLCRQTDLELNEPLVEVPMEEKMDYAEKAVLNVISMFVEAILAFYELDDQIRPNDRNRELFENLVTNIVLDGEVYFLLFNLCSSWLEPQQRALRRLMFSSETLENALPIQSLTALPQFQFNVAHREKYEREEQEAPHERNNSGTTNSNDLTRSTANTTNLASSGSNTGSRIKIVGISDQSAMGRRTTANSEGKLRSRHRPESDANYVYKGQPFSMAIKELQKLTCLESPMSKLEWIYNCCTRQVSKEISLFWKGYKIPTKDLFVDPDNLQGIIIYVVSRLRNPQIITDIHFVRKFVPKGVKKLSRFYHCEMVGAACSYLLQTEQENQDQLASFISQEVAQQSLHSSKRAAQRLDPAYEAVKESSRRSVLNKRLGQDIDGSDQEADDEVISWNELAFGQSMRSNSQSFLASRTGGQVQSQNYKRLRQLTTKNNDPYRVTSRQQSQASFTEHSLETRQASPTFQSRTDPHEKAQVATDGARGSEPAWVVGTEENLKTADKAAESPDETPQILVVDSNIDFEEDQSRLRHSERNKRDRSANTRDKNKLLDQINKLRYISYRDIEEKQTRRFAARVSQSLLQGSGSSALQKTIKDPYAAALDDSGLRSSQFLAPQRDDSFSDEEFEAVHNRSHSVIDMDDKFFFQNNLVLKKDIRARLGEQTELEMVRAAKKGYDTARCVSEL